MVDHDMQPKKRRRKIETPTFLRTALAGDVATDEKNLIETNLAGLLMVCVLNKNHPNPWDLLNLFSTAVPFWGQTT